MLIAQSETEQKFNHTLWPPVQGRTHHGSWEKNDTGQSRDGTATSVNSVMLRHPKQTPMIRATVNTKPTKNLCYFQPIKPKSRVKSVLRYRRVSKDSPSRMTCTDDIAVGWFPGWNADRRHPSALRRLPNTPGPANLCASYLNLPLGCTTALGRKIDTHIWVKQK